MRAYKRKFRALALWAACALMSCWLLGAGTALAAPDGEKTVVRIPCGINSLLYFDGDGEAAGSCRAYLDALAKINNWEYEYVETSWAEALEGLETGEIDLLFPVSMTPERMETMGLSAMIGGYTASGLFAREDSGYTYADYAGFQNARIAVTEGSSNETALAAFAEEHNFAYEPVYIGTTAEKAEALQAGGVDMVIFSAANELPGAKLVSVLDAEPFYYAVKKGNDALLDQLDSGMEELLMSDPDLVAQTFSGCILGANGVNRVAFTGEELRFIEEGEPITVGFYEKTEPLAYVDEDGTYRGVYVELMEYVRDAVGLNIELCPISRDTYWQDQVQSGAIDFYIGASDAAEVANAGFLTTASFMDFEAVLVTGHDYEFRTDETMTIALTKGRLYWDKELLAQFKNAEIIYCNTAKDCLRAVKRGNADAALLNTIEWNYQSKNARFSSLVQWPNYYLDHGAVLAAAGDVDPMVYTVMDKALGVLTDAQVTSVINANLNMSYQSSEPVDYIYAARYGIIVVGAVFAVTAAVWLTVDRARRKQRAIREEAREREREQLRIMTALSLDYVSIYYVDLDADTYTIVDLADRLRDEVADVAKNSHVFSATMREYTEKFILPEYQDSIYQLIDREALIARFREEKDCVIRYRVRPNAAGQEFFEMHFVDAGERPEEHLMVLGFRCVDTVAREEIAQQKALKEAFDAATSASHAKSDFLSKMSHDIRTPMNAIIGMTAIAAAHIDDKERVQDALSKITSSSRHLLALINEVLDMSKIESGKIELNEEEFNLSELLDNLLLLVQPQITQHGHQLEVHILNIEHEDVVGDSLRIQQVFVNLMGNAIKYTPDHGHICLTVREKYSERLYACYEFVFEDDGIGMAPEFVKHIFEPFARAEDVRTSKIQGTGLGMSISQNIVQMMNGDIQVESELGKGSKFTVTIFLKLQDKQELNPEELAGLPVLVADDDQIACESTCLMLSEIGMESQWVLSGAEAVERVEEACRQGRDFYAVILDWKMPGMNGVETARAIRKIVTPETPVIILSAYDWSEIESEARAAGVDAFLSKPVFKSGLVRLFKSLKSGETEKETVRQALDNIQEQDFSGRRALLVEDNELNMEIAIEIIGMTGIQLETAENGKEAVDKFIASEPGWYDIIFMDVQMPVMNGYDATAAIRALDRQDARRVPILAMTANAFAEDVQAAKSVGMNEHLAKPLDFDKLTAALKKYLS